MAYIDVSKLQRLFFRCHKILPLVYDESLSYYEVLCKVAASLNETIETVNELNVNVTDVNGRLNNLTEVVEDIAAYINTFDAKMTAKFDALEAAINAKVDRDLADMQAQVDAAIASLDKEIREFKAEMEHDLKEFEDKINALITAELELIDEKFYSLESYLKGYIYNELQKILEEIPPITTVYVVDPTTGELTEIQYVINHLYDAMRIYAYTAAELDAFGWTVDEIDHMPVNGIPRGLTAYEWDMFAKQIIGEAKKGFVNDYLNGELVPLQRNVDINNSMIKESGCYEVAEFESVGGTVATLDNLHATALDWDWKSNNIYVA